MNHLEFGPKFVMLATHPLEYLTCFGFVCAVTFLGDIFSQISAGGSVRKSNAVVMMDGAKDEGEPFFLSCGVLLRILTRSL